MVAVESQASTSIIVEPVDPVEMKKIIDELGVLLLSGQDGPWPDSPAVRLASIQDERVIPWFAKAFATRDYGMKFAALNALAKFNQVEAFNVLKAGMDTKGGDVGNATTLELANQSADNIRHGAAIALSRSPYPGAMAFLISRRNDPYWVVRNTIVIVLGEMPRTEALPILEEMSRDQDSRVSNGAKHVLGLLTAKK
jgi:HEAT repeat protein